MKLTLKRLRTIDFAKDDYQLALIEAISPDFYRE
jgi:hypothetical protein